MRILYDHQVFSLQDAGGASRYHFELLRNFQNVFGVSTEVLLGLNGSVMPFAALQGKHTQVFGHRTMIKPGFLRYGINELFSAAVAPLLVERTVDDDVSNSNVRWCDCPLSLPVLRFNVHRVDNDILSFGKDLRRTHPYVTENA